MSDRAAQEYGEAGFTLLEMLVALAVFSIAALTLLRLDGFAIRSAGDLDERTAAQIVAQNHAVELWTDSRAPAIGTRQIGVRNAGRDWRIEERVAATADPAMLRIDLIIRPSQGSGQLVLTIVRPAI